MLNPLLMMLMYNIKEEMIYIMAEVDNTEVGLEDPSEEVVAGSRHEWLVMAGTKVLEDVRTQQREVELGTAATFYGQ